jgi:hypothetical protein
MLTVLAEFGSRQQRDDQIDELRDWFIGNNVPVQDTLLGVCFVMKDIDAVNMAEKLLFSRKFKGLGCTMRENKKK